MFGRTRFLSHHTFAAAVILALAVTLFGSKEAPSSSYQKEFSISWLAERIISAATPLSNNSKIVPFGLKKRLTAHNNCFPRYEKSSYISGSYCIALIEIGADTVHISAYKVKDKNACSYIIGRQVKLALTSLDFKNCIKPHDTDTI